MQLRTSGLWFWQARTAESGYFSAAPVALSRSIAMLLRLLRLFFFAAASVILVASPARSAPEKVQYTGDAKSGTIVIQSEERSLYLITGKDQALKYSVGVGRTGQQWFGTTRIASKHIKPAWKPPAARQALAGLLY
jgi:hypothetical protein